MTHSYELSPVVHSSKQDVREDEFISSVDLIENEELKKLGGNRLTDKLKASAGLEIVKTGISGGQAAIFLRGLDARHTAFAIDGVRVFDSASIQRLLNPSLINSLDIERIEILRGAQSVLYGSDAIGGVINIITKKNNVKNNLFVDLGQQSRFGTDNSFLLKKVILNLKTFYQEDLNHNDTNLGSEKDKKFNKGLSLNLSYIGEDIESYTRFKLSHDFSETDGQDFSNDIPIDADDSFARVEQVFLHQNLKINLIDKNYLNLDLSGQKTKRLNVSGDFESIFVGDLVQAELRYVHDKSLFGVNRTNEIYKDQDIKNLRVESFGIFANQLLAFSLFNLEVGGRLTGNEFYGEHFVYNLALLKKIGTFHSFHLAQKTGFKAPSPYQLFGRTPFGVVGNEELAPEKSLSLEFGYQFQAKHLRAEVNLFQNSIESAIGFENNRYINANSLFNQGIELILSFDKGRFQTQANLTLIDFGDGEDAFLERKPAESFNLNQLYMLSDKEKIGLNYRYRGPRFEDINGKREILSAYSVVDMTFEKVVKAYTFQLTLLNVFDTFYEEAHLFRTQRFGAQGQVSYSY